MQIAPAPDDARLILREEELDAVLELLLLAEAALRGVTERALETEDGLGAGHYRAAFLLKRRPGLGVRELARLTGLSKQRASRVLKDLGDKGMVDAAEPAEDARRRPMALSAAGAEAEDRVSQRLRAHLAAVGARRVLTALAGRRARRGDVA